MKLLLHKSRLTNKTRLASLFLAFTLAVSSISAMPSAAKAVSSDSSVITFLDTNAAISLGQTVRYPFSLPSAGYTKITIFVPSPANISIKILRNSDVSPIYDTVITGTGWKGLINDQYYHTATLDYINKGDYTLYLTSTNADTPFSVLGTLDTSITSVTPSDPQTEPSISKKSLTLTKGFSQKLTVSNAQVRTWNSNKPKIATVNQNGKVTAKSTGSAKITAVTTTGQTISCSVQVKANVYKKAKMSLKQTRYGNAYISVTNISYNKKGDMIIKASYLNNCGHKIIKLSNINIKVKNKSGKMIGTYTAKSKKTSIPQKKSKSFTYTVKKSKLKLKSTQDLRLATVKPSWKYTYQY